jgi:hypothetical protein
VKREDSRIDTRHVEGNAIPSNHGLLDFRRVYQPARALDWNWVEIVRRRSARGWFGLGAKEIDTVAAGILRPRAIVVCGEYVGSAFFKTPSTPSEDTPVTTNRKRSRASHGKSKSLVASTLLSNKIPAFIS